MGQCVCVCVCVLKDGCMCAYEAVCVSVFVIGLYVVMFHACASGCV